MTRIETPTERDISDAFAAAVAADAAAQPAASKPPRQLPSPYRHLPA